MVFYSGTMQFYVVSGGIERSMVVGSVYQSPELYVKVQGDMDADNSTSDVISHWFAYFDLM
ncbi:hypothetical protein Hanom_Chr14g01254421 [Helianthus anomalus]